MWTPRVNGQQLSDEDRQRLRDDQAVNVTPNVRITLNHQTGLLRTIRTNHGCSDTCPNRWMQHTSSVYCPLMGRVDISVDALSGDMTWDHSSSISPRAVGLMCFSVALGIMLGVALSQSVH